MVGSAACSPPRARAGQAQCTAPCRFHVDDLSSAHVYLRLPQGTTMQSIPERTLTECCQLVKANSIQGSKNASVNIVYTPWGNLRKTASMDTGQAGRQLVTCPVTCFCTHADVEHAAGQLP